MVDREDWGSVRKTETQLGISIRGDLIWRIVEEGVGKRKKYKRNTEAVWRYQLLKETVTTPRARRVEGNSEASRTQVSEEKPTQLAFSHPRRGTEVPLAPLRHRSRTDAGRVERSWRQDPDSTGTGVPESSPSPAFHSPSVSYWQNL